MLSVLRLLLLSVYSVIASCLGALLGVVRPFNPNNTSLCARLFAAPSQWLLRIKVETELGHLNSQTQACVIIANHQSNYDLFVLGGTVPSRTVSLGKKSLKWIPVFGQLYWLAGNVLIDRSNASKARQTMLTTTETLQKRQTSIWVFPEGTRNAGTQLLPFKKGAFQMAIAAGAPIVPVCVSRYTQSLDLNRWDSGQIRVRALPAIPTAHLSLEDMPALIEQCRTRMQACIDELDEELEQRLAAAQPL